VFKYHDIFTILSKDDSVFTAAEMNAVVIMTDHDPTLLQGHYLKEDDHRWSGHFSKCPQEYAHYCVHGSCHFVQEQNTPACRLRGAFWELEFVKVDWTHINTLESRNVGHLYFTVAIIIFHLFIVQLKKYKNPVQLSFFNIQPWKKIKISLQFLNEFL
uniref:Uncharacterized protein n=1 Tax=Astyanax mexicanus TaxID=7994 RepID=A0A8B9H2W8_ASTMX